MIKTAQEVAAELYAAASCAQVKQSRNYLGVLRPAAALAYQDAARARGDEVSVPDMLHSINDVEQKYGRIQASAAGDVFADSPARHVRSFVEAVASSGLVRDPELAQGVKMASAFVKGQEALVRWIAGPEIRLMSARDLVTQNRSLQQQCIQVFNRVYTQSLESPEAAEFYSALLEGTGVDTDPLASPWETLARHGAQMGAESVGGLLARDGSLDTENPACVKSAQRRTQEAYTLARRNAEDISRIASDVNSIGDAVRQLALDAQARDAEMKAREQIARAAQQQHEFDQLKIDAARSGVFLLSRLVGGPTGQRIEALGNVAITLSESFSKFRNTLTALEGLNFAAALATTAFTGNVVGAVLGLFSGPSIEEQTLQEVRELRRQVAELGAFIQQRFEVIDARLNQIYAEMHAGLNDLLTSTDRIEDRVARVQLRLEATYDLVTQLGLDQSRLFAEVLTDPQRKMVKDAARDGRIFRQNRGTRIATDQFKAYAQAFSHLGADVAASEAATNAPFDISKSPLVSVVQSWRSIRRLAVAAGISEAGKSALVNPFIWQEATDAHVGLIFDFWPSGNDETQLSIAIALELIQAGRGMQTALDATFFETNGRFRTAIVQQAFESYRQALIDLRARVAELHRQNRDSLGNFYQTGPIDIFDLSSYARMSFNRESYAAAAGMPETVFNWLPGDEVEAVVALRLGAIGAEWSDHRFEGAHWTYRERSYGGGGRFDREPRTETVKDKVFARAHATLRVFLNAQGQRLTVAVLRVHAEQESWLPERVFSDPVIPDPTRPNLNVSEFMLFWDSRMKGNLPAYAAEIAPQENDATPEAARQILNGWYSVQQANFLQSLNTTALTVEFSALNAARHFLEAIFVIATPNLVETSDVLRSAFTGAGKLADSSSLLARFQAAAEAAQKAPFSKFPDIIDEEIARADQYSKVLLEKLQETSAAREKNPILADGITKLEILVLGLGGSLS